jgi:hypothetical protein
MPARDIRRDAPAWEEPDVDAGAFPLHGVHTSSIVVEAVTVSVGGGGCNSATVVGIVRVAVGVQEGGSGLRACGVDGASCCCVEGDLVCACEVDAFNYVDFAAVGPVWTEEPISAVVSVNIFSSSSSSSFFPLFPANVPGTDLRLLKVHEMKQEYLVLTKTRARLHKLSLACARYQQ